MRRKDKSDEQMAIVRRKRRIQGRIQGRKVRKEWKTDVMLKVSVIWAQPECTEGDFSVRFSLLLLFTSVLRSSLPSWVSFSSIHYLRWDPVDFVRFGYLLERCENSQSTRRLDAKQTNNLCMNKCREKRGRSEEDGGMKEEGKGNEWGSWEQRGCQEARCCKTEMRGKGRRRKSKREVWKTKREKSRKEHQRGMKRLRRKLGPVVSSQSTEIRLCLLFLLSWFAMWVDCKRADTKDDHTWDEADRKPEFRSSHTYKKKHRLSFVISLVLYCHVASRPFCDSSLLSPLFSLFLSFLPLVIPGPLSREEQCRWWWHNAPQDQQGRCVHYPRDLKRRQSERERKPDKIASNKQKPRHIVVTDLVVLAAIHKNYWRSQALCSCSAAELHSPRLPASTEKPNIDQEEETKQRTKVQIESNTYEYVQVLLSSNWVIQQCLNSNEKKWRKHETRQPTAKKIRRRRRSISQKSAHFVLSE